MGRPSVPRLTNSLRRILETLRSFTLILAAVSLRDTPFNVSMISSFHLDWSWCE
ncbi:hypothetical protein [Holdemanella biformis]|uniref:hypothetical protein n=1 Tax=Holdemanella biformis TaxID=1735 RepID=UPI0022E474B6|nr:hypothetical protein [Holdemanella biformis]